jgi:hypothetical protein
LFDVEESGRVGAEVSSCHLNLCFELLMCFEILYISSSERVVVRFIGVSKVSFNTFPTVRCSEVLPF